MWQTNAVALVGVTRKVHDAHKLIVSAVSASGLGLTNVGNEVVIAIGGVDPLKSGVGIVPQCCVGAVELVQTRDQCSHPSVIGAIVEPPIKRIAFVPLLLLGEFLSHEEELLAGVRPLIGIECAQARHLLPMIAWHLRDKRALAVNNLIMRQGQDIVLGEGVDQREGELTVVPPAIDRIFREIAQGVVHPPHVPLHAKTEASAGSRSSHSWPSG